MQNKILLTCGLFGITGLWHFECCLNESDKVTVADGNIKPETKVRVQYKVIGGAS